MTKAGKILTIIGAILAGIEIVAYAVLLFGVFAFFALGEGEYLAEYLVLRGYYPIINLMFFADYLAASIGSMGFPMLVPGIILLAIGKSRDKKRAR